MDISCNAIQLFPDLAVFLCPSQIEMLPPDSDSMDAVRIKIAAIIRKSFDASVGGVGKAGETCVTWADLTKE